MNNPEKFPCTYNDKMVGLSDCERCKDHMKCDIYATMLDETETEDE